MPHLRFQLPKRVTKKFNSSRSPKKCIEIRRLETNPISENLQNLRYRCSIFQSTFVTVFVKTPPKVTFVFSFYPGTKVPGYSDVALSGLYGNMKIELLTSNFRHF
jgi:hypothetical protein